MSTARSAIKIEVHLDGTHCCHSCFQQAAGVVTNLSTGEKFDIKYGYEIGPIYSASKQTPVEQTKAEEGCIRTVTLYSTKDFYVFVKLYQEAFSQKDFDFCFKNCSDAVKFTLDYFCPEHPGVDAFCCTYKILCCWFFYGTLGMKCFPPVCCSTPSHVFDLAMTLSCTSYGIPLEVPTVTATLPDTLHEEKKIAPLSDKDHVSVLAFTSGGVTSLYQLAARDMPTTVGSVIVPSTNSMMRSK